MVRATELTKYFGGKRALGPISFEIARGETIGFLGLNGAGKTTLLRILAGDLRPSAGALEVDGADAVRDPLAVRRRVGFLPELPPVYPDMTVQEYIRFAGRLRGMDESALARRLAEVEELTDLTGVRDELTRNLSQGYRQRVGLAQAIIHEPELLILDEPTHDLDPAQIVEMRALLGALKNRHTILVSSHNLPEISQTCDRLFVIDSGQVIASGSETELAARWLDVQRIEVTVRLPAVTPAADGAAATTDGMAASEEAVAAVAESIRGVDAVRQVAPLSRDGDGLRLVVESAEDRRAEVCRALVERGYDVIGLERSRRKLENVFLELVRGDDGARDNGHPTA